MNSVKYSILIAFILIICSCKQEPKCLITNEALYFSNGIKNGFTIQLINVSKFDTAGIPLEYAEDIVRADFVNETSKEIKDVFFSKKNPNGYWSYQLSGKIDTLPIKFEKGKWYRLASNEFCKGIFCTTNYHFFIYKADNGNLSIYIRYYGSNF